MIRTIRGRQSGMSAIPFVVSIVVIVIFAFMWHQESGDAEKLRSQLATEKATAEDQQKKREELSNRLLALTEATGFGDANGMPDREAILKATEEFLQAWRDKLFLEFAADRYQNTGTAGTIEQLAGDKVKVTYVPAKDMIDAPSVQAVYPIVVQAAAKMQSDIKAAFEQKYAEMTSKKEMEEKHRQDLAAKDAKYAELQAAGEQAKRLADEQLNELRGQKANLETAVQQAQSESEQVKQDSERAVAEANSQIAQLKAERNALVAREKPFLSEAPDGEVLASGGGVVVVNRGKKDMLMPGTVFTVLHRIKGGDLVPSGAIRVIVCNEESAECKVMEQSAAMPIQGGDMIQSLTYSPNRQMRFCLIGEFSKMGRAQMEARLKSLGAAVDTAVTPMTHYLVVGTAPAGEDLEQSDAYRKAREYGVEKLTETELAAFTIL